MIHEETPNEGRTLYSGFLPVFIIGLSFFALLGYQLTLIVNQRSVLQTQISQQRDVVTRALKAEQALKQLVEDLVSLSETDTEAKAIVTKYRISKNGPAAPQQ